MRIRSLIALALGLTALSAAAQAAPQNSGNAFNPGIGLVLNGTWASYPTEAGHRQIPGFMLGDGAGLPPQGFGLGESELDLASNFDNLFTGFGALSFHENHGQDSVEVELAYLQTLAMPDGFQVTAGKFFSSFGYQNARHAHVWDFVDQPLAYEAMLNNQYSDPGMQLTWLAPTDTYLLFGAEAFSGDNFPAGGAAHSGNGANNLFVKLSQDVGDSSTWFAGLSYMSARAFNRPSFGDGDAEFSDQSDLDGPLFTGTSNIVGADFVWKWAPHGNFYEKNFVFQTEFLHRSERGTLSNVGCAVGNACNGASAYTGSANGWYVQGTYQWMPQWRVGLRYDRLTSDNTVTGFYQPGQLLGNGFAPHRESAMVDFSNSEFSRIRLQYNRDQSGLIPANEVMLQYIVAMGAHPAHTF
ncbi:MAG TPA: TonB-dependent receptor [Gammaproteobacteria bacterium]|nr:TonB-dependent receptor [Gammaproteobacteria bacterium]